MCQENVRYRLHNLNALLEKFHKQDISICYTYCASVEFFFFWEKGNVLQGVGTPSKLESFVPQLIDNFSPFFLSSSSSSSSSSFSSFFSFSFNFRCIEPAPYSFYSNNTCDPRFICLAQTMKFRHLLTTQGWTRKSKKKVLGYQTRLTNKGEE